MYMYMLGVVGTGLILIRLFSHAPLKNAGPRIQCCVIQGIFTFLGDKWVIRGCETDIGDADLVELVRVPGSSIVIINSGIAEQWSSQTFIKL